MQKILIMLACIVLNACSPATNTEPQKGPHTENHEARNGIVEQTNNQNQAKEDAKDEITEEKFIENRRFLDFIKEHTGFDAIEEKLFNNCTPFTQENSKTNNKSICEIVDHAPCSISSDACGIVSDVFDQSIQSMVFKFPYESRNLSELETLEEKYGASVYKEQKSPELKMEKNSLTWQTDQGYEISFVRLKGINAHDKPYDSGYVYFINTKIPNYRVDDEVISQQSTVVAEEKTNAIKKQEDEYYERCTMALSIHIRQKIADRQYFGYATIAGVSFPEWPVILIYKPGLPIPATTGKIMLSALRMMGNTKVPLDNGFEVDAKVLGVGDEYCEQQLANF